MNSLCEIDVCRQPSNICRIRPQDFDLSACGVPQTPSNARFLDLYKTFLYSNVLHAADLPLLDEKKSVDDHSDFFLFNIRPVIQSNATDYKVRFQWPSGRYSSNQLQDVRTWLGALTPNPIRIPAGRWIGIELDYGQATNDNHDKNVVIALECVRRIYLR